MKSKKNKVTGVLSALFWVVLLPIVLFVTLTIQTANLTLGVVVAVVIVFGLILNEPIQERIACFFQQRKVLRKRIGITKKYEGHLFAYGEQGWEGRIDYTLFIEGWERPFPLQNGQRLTIYAEDGKVLWSGVLCFVKVRWWDQHKLPYDIWSEVKPAGASYARWMEWFAHQPPLKASVEVEAETEIP